MKMNRCFIVTDIALQLNTGVSDDVNSTVLILILMDTALQPEEKFKREGDIVLF